MSIFGCDLKSAQRRCLLIDDHGPCKFTDYANRATPSLISDNANGAMTLIGGMTHFLEDFLCLAQIHHWTSQDERLRALEQSRGNNLPGASNRQLNNVRVDDGKVRSGN